MDQKPPAQKLVERLEWEIRHGTPAEFPARGQSVILSDKWAVRRDEHGFLWGISLERGLLRASDTESAGGAAAEAAAGSSARARGSNGRS